jgi:hypothetical protein
MNRRAHPSYLPPIVTLAVAGFIGLIVIFALDEYWDLPARSFGAMLKPIRPYEFSIKVVAALCLFITVLGVLREAILRIQRLSHMLTMCAWCRRVSVEGDWISIDQFLQQRKNTSSSVGLCPDCYSTKASQKAVSTTGRDAQRRLMSGAG